MMTPLEAAKLQLRLRAALRQPGAIVKAKGPLGVKVGDTQFSAAELVAFAATFGRVSFKDAAAQPGFEAMAREIAALAGLKIETPAQTQTAHDREIAKMRGGELGEAHRRVVSALEAAGEFGLTDAEIEQELGRGRGSFWRTRRDELVKAGYAADSHEQRRVEGRSRKVWKLTKYMQPHEA